MNVVFGKDIWNLLGISMVDSEQVNSLAHSADSTTQNPAKRKRCFSISSIKMRKVILSLPKTPNSPNNVQKYVPSISFYCEIRS